MHRMFYIPAIIGVVIGVVTRSWLWGIASFFISLGIIVAVGSRTYRKSTKGNIQIDENLYALLRKLEEIGTSNNNLPLFLRGWCNILGLYVQLKTAAGMQRLQAGEKKTTEIDARTKWEEPGDWVITKYKPGSWEKLIDPTLEIVGFLDYLNTRGHIREEDLMKLNDAIKRYEFFGDISSLHLLKETTCHRDERVSIENDSITEPENIQIDSNGSLVTYEPTKREILEEILKAENKELYRRAFKYKDPGKTGPPSMAINPFNPTDFEYLLETLLGSRHFETERLDSILKKFLGDDDYDKYYQDAKERIISRH